MIGFLGSSKQAQWVRFTQTWLTVRGHSTEVLLQLGHVKSTRQRLALVLVVAERGGEVGVRGMETGHAAGYLRQSSGQTQTQRVLRVPAVSQHTCSVVFTSLLLCLTDHFFRNQFSFFGLSYVDALRVILWKKQQKKNNQGKCFMAVRTVYI